MDLQSNLQGNWPQIHSIEASDTQSSDEKHRSSRCFEAKKLQIQWSIVDPKQGLQSRHSTQNTAQSIEIVNSKKASTDFNTGSEYRSTGKSTGYFRSTTWSATRSTLTVTVKVRKQPPVANTVESISHANFRSSFQTNRTEVEKKQMRQIQIQLQVRGTHNYRQRDPDLQTDLQSNLQEDPPPNLQVDLQMGLQMDLQANLQVRMDLQPDLWVQTGLGDRQNSPLVSFQAETSTERKLWVNEAFTRPQMYEWWVTH